MFNLFVDSLIILPVVVDPVAVAPLFAALTHGESAAAKRRIAIRGTSIAGGILVVFALAGGMGLLGMVGRGHDGYGGGGGFRGGGGGFGGGGASGRW